MHDDFVADVPVPDVGTGLIDDARRVGAADVEVFRFAGPVANANDVDGRTEAGPDIVVVDACRHDVHEHVVRADFRHVDDLRLERLAGLPEAGLADELRVHPRRDVPERRHLAEVVEILQFFGHAAPHRRLSRRVFGVGTV